MLGLQVIGLYAWRVGIPSVEQTQLTVIGMEIEF